MRAVLFADGDVLRPEHFEGDHEGEPVQVVDPGPDPGIAPDPDETGVVTRGSLERRLADVLDREVDRAIATGSGARPLGKWIESDLVVAAERVTGGVARQAGALLGLPDTTFRRRLGKAKMERDAGLVVRSETWDDVRTVLDALVSERHGTESDLAAELERAVLEAVIRCCGDDIRQGARLLGVTEPTYLKRRSLQGAGMASA